MYTLSPLGSYLGGVFEIYYFNYSMLVFLFDQKRLTIEQFVNENETQVVNNTDGAQKFLDSHHNLNEQIMKELGVSVLWFTSYNEIPEILNSISK